MTTLKDVTEIARLNFESAHADLDADLAATRTPAEARAVRQNREAALAAYMDLIAASLDSFDQEWELLVKPAREAAAALTEARQNAASHADRIRLMADVTSSLADVAKALNG